MTSSATTILTQISFLLFLFSGFCGLLYQVVWLRLAFSAFGILTPVLSVVVSVFMLGLALVSWSGVIVKDYRPYNEYYLLRRARRTSDR